MGATGGFSVRGLQQADRIRPGFFIMRQETSSSSVSSPLPIHQQCMLSERPQLYCWSSIFTWMIAFHEKGELRLSVCFIRLRSTGSWGRFTSGCLSPSMCRRLCFRGSQASSAPYRRWRRARPTLLRTRPLWTNASAFSSKESMCWLWKLLCVVGMM